MQGDGKCRRCGHSQGVHSGPGEECRHDHEPYARKAKEQCLCIKFVTREEKVAQSQGG